MFSLTLAGCVYGIVDLYKKWSESPVIISFASKETSIDSIPFPAVTICSESKSNLLMYNHKDVSRKYGNHKPITTEEYVLLILVQITLNKLFDNLILYTYIFVGNYA